MDAVMVVHQLQRLATASPPSASLAAKLPRVAIGICYFIDHPEIGVRQQAANAVKAVALKHHEILRLSCCGDLQDSPGSSCSNSSSRKARGSASVDDRSPFEDTTNHSRNSSISSTPRDSSSVTRDNSNSPSPLRPEKRSDEDDVLRGFDSKDVDSSRIKDPDIGTSDSNGEGSSQEGGGIESDSKTNGRRSRSTGGTGDCSAPARTEKNLITLLQRHVDSEDEIIRECCRAALKALLQPSETAAVAAATERGAAPSIATPGSADADAAPVLLSEKAAISTSNSSVVAGKTPAAAAVAAAAASEAFVTVTSSSAGAAASTAMSHQDTASASPTTAQQDQQHCKKPIDAGEPTPQGRNSDPVGSPENRSSFVSSASPCPSRSDVAGASPSFSSSSSNYTPLEGELCTVLLGLRGLLRQYEILEQQEFVQFLRRLSGTGNTPAEPRIISQSLEKLRKNLQYRLVRVPGVSSVTITLNTRYLQQQLARWGRTHSTQQQQQQNHTCNNSSSSSDTRNSADCSSIDNPTSSSITDSNSTSSGTNTSSSSSSIISSSDGTSSTGRETNTSTSSTTTVEKYGAIASQIQHTETTNQREEEREEREEGDGVAVLLMRLPLSPRKRLRALQAVKEVCGPLTLILRATRVYEHRGTAATRSRRSSNKRDTGVLGDPAGTGNLHQQHQDSRECISRTVGEEQEELEEEKVIKVASGGTNAATAAGPTYLDDERNSGRRQHIAAVPAASESRYSSREEDEEQGEHVTCFQQQSGAAEGPRQCTGDGVDGEGFCGWGPTAAGFSFFSRNSALFSQSRHLSSYLLPYEEDEREIAVRLKKEKELKQQMQRQQAARESVVDRVLSNIGKGLFW